MKETKRLTSKEAALWLQERDNFLILTHRNPDGDALGSAAGLCRGLREVGKSAYVLENPDTTRRYLEYVSPYIAPENYTPGCIVSVDTASAKMLPVNAVQYADQVELCIDHHPSNTAYAENLCLEGERAACGEIIYDILMALSHEVSPEAALPLYVAITTDTGCFAYANTTGDTLEVAAALLRKGIDHRSVNKALFRTKTKARVALDGALYSSLQYFRGGEIAAIVLTQELRKSTGVTEDDIDDVAAIPGVVEGVIVGITVKELVNGGCKVSVRTSPGVDANLICQRFGGGGHNMAAGCTLDSKPEETVLKLVEAAQEVMG